MKEARSPAAGFIDKLEREVLAARPLTGRRVSVGHVITGALAGAAAVFLLNLPALDSPDYPWGRLAGGMALSALAFALAGRTIWNRLLAAYSDELTAQARANLLERELLMLALAEEMPARYEHLKTAAQSYGKTRARNWNELRKGSMQDRIAWLVENYGELCRIQKLPATTVELQRLTSWLTWLMLAPLGFPLFGIAAAFMRWLPTGPLVWLILGGTGLFMLTCLTFGGVLSMLSRVQRVAVLSVLVEQLDIDLAGRDAEPQAPASSR